MKQHRRRGKSILRVAGLLLLGFASLVALMLFTAEVRGTANLPGGHSLAIASTWRTGDYSISENSQRTLVQFAGRQLEFTESFIYVDGVELAGLPDSPASLELAKKNGVVEVAVSGGEVIALAAE